MTEDRVIYGTEGHQRLQLRILHVPDLHLYDKEIGVSLGYPQQSLDILKSVKEELISGDYDMITLGGDIQHAKITNTRYISDFQKAIKELGVIAKERLLQRNLLEKIKVYDKENKLINISEMESILFSVRGQHDTNSIEEFTFFDLLIENHILLNPRVIMIDGLQLNFLNYSKKLHELEQKRNTETKALISIFHNPILEDGVFIDTYIGTTISPTSHNIFHNVDLAIINDIHIPIPIYDVAKGESKTMVVTPGSLGRTSFNNSHDRDFGNIIKVEVEEGTDGVYGLDVSLLEVDLVPADEFFNKSEAFKKKRVENAFKNFCLEIEDASMNYFDITEEIHKTVKDPEIRNICLSIMEQVD